MQNRIIISNNVLENLNSQIITNAFILKSIENKIYSKWYETTMNEHKPKKDISQEIIYQ